MRSINFSNNAFVIGVPRSGTTYFSSLLAKYLDLPLLSEPLRDAILNGRNQLIPQHRGLQRLLRFLPSSYKYHIFHRLSNYMAHANKSDSLVIKETWRRHDGIDLPTSFIDNLIFSGHPKVVAITRNSYDVYKSIINRGDTVKRSTFLAISIAWNCSAFASYISNHAVISIKYEDLLSQNSNMIVANTASKLYRHATNNDVQVIDNSKNKSFHITGIGDKSALRLGQPKKKSISLTQLEYDLIGFTNDFLAKYPTASLRETLVAIYGIVDYTNIN